MAHNWKQTVVSPDMSLIDVIRVIDREALRIALVVDENYCLLGTVTDGDVRRALISGQDLSVRADEIMNTSPTTVPTDASDTEVKSLMQSKHLLSIPVIDEHGRLVSFEAIEDLLFQATKDNPVFLMAGGFGTRLSPLTDNCPKPMLEIGGKPVLQIILNRFLESGFRNFYFSTHYLPEVIHNHFSDGKKFGCNIQYIHEETPLGTGGALGLLPKDLPDGPLIMMNGDILTKVDFSELLDFHNASEGAATVCVRQHQHQVPYGVIEAKEHEIVRMVEKPKYDYFVNAGVYVIDRDVIRSVEKNEHVDMPELIERQMAAGCKVSVFPIHEYWLDIGSSPDFEKAQNDFGDT